MAIEPDPMAKLMEQSAFQFNSEHCRLLIEHYLPVCIHEFDRNGRILSINRAGLAMLGTFAEGTHCATVFDAGVSDSVRIRALFAEALRGQTCHFTFTTLSPVPRHFKSCFIPILNPEKPGEALTVLGVTEDITTRVATETALEQANADLSATLQAIPDLLFELSQDGHYLNIWAHDPQLLAHQKATLMGHSVAEMLPAEGAATVMQSLDEARRHGYAHGATICLELSIGTRWFELSTAIKKNPGQAWQDAPTFMMLSRDITERKMAEIGLLQQEADLRISAIAFESREGMVITDEHARILRVNRSFVQITGYRNREVMGQSFEYLLESVSHRGERLPMLSDILAKRESWEGVIDLCRKNGEIFPAHLLVSVVLDPDRRATNLVLAFSDISAQRQSEEEIHHLAFYDQLTDLPNRRLFMDRLRQCMASSLRHQYTGALLFIDLDNFKLLNDSQGHATGDELLRRVALRLSTTVRAGDTVGRLGGDEFVVLLEGLAANLEIAQDEAFQISEKLRLMIMEPDPLPRHIPTCTASIGIALFHGTSYTPEDIMQQADIAMYQAKNSGRNALRFFDQPMQESIKRRTSMEAALRQALERQEFRLFHQIQVNHRREVVGVEGLIRWQHPEHGLLAPDHFIPIAEESGLIVPMGVWVIECACQRLSLWSSDPDRRKWTFAVNVSARQFHDPGFLDQVRDVLVRYAVAPSQLKFELTESLLIQNREDIIAVMNELVHMGIVISLDDFGTGYSSLQYLKNLPLQQLKIDRSFVRDIATDPADLTIVRTIIAMANSMNLDVIAEGVETIEQFHLLLASGCSAFQGYFFGRPTEPPPES